MSLLVPVRTHQRHHPVVVELFVWEGTNDPTTEWPPLTRRNIHRLWQYARTLGGNDNVATAQRKLWRKANWLAFLKHVQRT
uniref:Uncharacterized protein n=1 Tax=Bovine immunodeficiency virus (strain R29) TaxID=417296 RepID=Q65596_BIV29|nr:unknown [Bovine immunodeficiency virus R29]